MSVKAKYQSVLDLGENLNVTDGRVEEEGGKLNVWGTVETQYEKDQLWDAIKAVGGLALGVASDEVNRDGSINALKREHLLRAGADLIIPDYQTDLRPIF